MAGGGPRGGKIIQPYKRARRREGGGVVQKIALLIRCFSQGASVSLLWPPRRDMARLTPNSSPGGNNESLLFIPA